MSEATKADLQARFDEINDTVTRLDGERETLRRQAKGLTEHIAQLRKEAAALRVAYQLFCADDRSD